MQFKHTIFSSFSSYPHLLQSGPPYFFALQYTHVSSFVLKYPDLQTWHFLLDLYSSLQIMQPGEILEYSSQFNWHSPSSLL